MPLTVLLNKINNMKGKFMPRFEILNNNFVYNEQTFRVYAFVIRGDCFGKVQRC